MPVVEYRKMQVVLTKKEKEELVVKLYQDGKTIREIAQQAHLSFGTIGRIIKQMNGSEKDGIESKTLNNKSKETKALYLYLNGKRPIDVAIELNLSSDDVEYYQQEFWILNEMDDLALAYLEIRGHLDLFLRLFHIMKKNKIINQKDIRTVLKYATELPSLENKFRGLANTVLDLEIKKKELSAQLVDLGFAIDIKKQTLSQINQASIGRVN